MGRAGVLFYYFTMLVGQCDSYKPQFRTKWYSVIYLKGADQVRRQVTVKARTVHATKAWIISRT